MTVRGAWHRSPCMSDEREVPEVRPPQQGDDEAARHLQLRTGMSADAARAYLAYHAGRVSRAPRAD